MAHGIKQEVQMATIAHPRVNKYSHWTKEKYMGVLLYTAMAAIFVMWLEFYIRIDFTFL